MTISKFINNLLIGLTLLAFLAQLIIDFSSVNVATSTIILFSGLSTILYFRWSKALETNPLSSFAILGFCITSILGALIVQSASGLAVSADLRQPLVTFPMLAIYQLTAILAHCLYRLITKSSLTDKPSLLQITLNSLMLFDLPTVSVLWIVGIFGLFCVLLSHVLPVANAFSYLAWAPFLIPIYSLKNGPSYCKINTNYLFLVLHTSVITLLALFFNARGMLLTGVATVTLILILNAIRSQKVVTANFILRICVALFIGVALAFPATDLVKAMAVARADRGKISPIKLIENTIEDFKNPEKLEKYTKLAMAEKFRSAYDESYITNPLFARIITTKFHDNAMYFASKTSDRDDEDIINVTSKFFWIALPQPFLDILKIDVKKDDLQFSIGDLLANKVVATPLGGLRTGSIFGQGWAIFSYLFPLVYFGMCFILFAAIDVFSKRETNSVIVISVIGMLNLWPNFIFCITAESFHHLFIGVIRGVFQSVLLYFIAFSIARFLSKLFTKHTTLKSSLLVK